MVINKLKQLAKKYLAGKATKEEKQILHQWYDTADNGWVENVNTKNPETEEQVKQRILIALQKRISLQKESHPVAKYHGFSVKRILLSTVSIAAILLVGFFTVYLANKKPVANKQLVGACPKGAMSACSKMCCNGKMMN